MGKRVFRFFKIWGNIMIGAITVYPFVVTYLVPSKAQQGELTSLFGWSWQTWLIIFLLSIIFTLVTQNWIEKYDRDVSALPNTTNTSANNGGVAMQDVKNSPVRYNSPDTNITWNPSIPGFEIPTTKQILRKIGVEIQEFEEQFDRIRYKQLKNRHDEIVKAIDIFEKIRTGALRHANIELQGTVLLTLFKNLERELNKYPLQVGMALQYEEERMFYIQADKAYLPTIIERINQNGSEMEKTELNINMAVLQIKQFVNEYRGQNPPPNKACT